MGKLDIIGALVVVTVPQGNLPLLGLSLGVKGVLALLARKKNRKEETERLEEARELAEKAGITTNTGKVLPCLLEWSSLNCSLLDKKTGKPVRKLLNNLKGKAQPGRLLAIMGSSGSGKTTLLNSLANQLPVNKCLRLAGSITVNGHSHAAASHCTAYVQQQDVFYSQMTVRETIELAATLRLPNTVTAKDRLQAVEASLSRLGLNKCADTVIGDLKTPGVSGGEKKRLAIACELLRSPSLLFVDEPTSGLDASGAQQVMETLHQLAADGHTVVCSIHQPRSTIFNLLDDLVLLSNGEVVFYGPRAQAVEHFAGLGYPCPNLTNPAEHIADLIADDFSASVDKRESSKERVQKLLRVFNDQRVGEEATTLSVAPQMSKLPPPIAQSDRAGPVLQFRLLFKRAWKQVIRDKRNLKVRLASTLQAASVFGFIWWRLGTGQSTIQSRMGLLQITATYIAQTTLFKTLYVFPAEKNIMARERAKDAYQVGPFFLSKLLAEMPVAAGFPMLFGAVMYPMTGLKMGLVPVAKALGTGMLTSFASASLGLAVGAVSPSIDSALVIGPAVMLIFLVFGGLYTQTADVPKVLRWIPKASVINRGYEGLSVNEFRGLKFDNEGPGSVATGEDVLKRMGYGNSTVGSSAVGLGKILLLQYWITYDILKGQKPKFQPLLPAE